MTMAILAFPPAMAPATIGDGFPFAASPPQFQSFRTSSTLSLSIYTLSSSFSIYRHCLRSIRARSQTSPMRKSQVKDLSVVCSSKKKLKVMISGAPASGKGTQCEMIVKKFGLVHISTGDLLRAEVSSATEIGKKAKDYMDKGILVPDDIVTDMVLSRLSQPDVRDRGWLLDGYPRSSSQAECLEKNMIRPDIFIMLEVPDEILIGRCVGRRLDPVTGKIYHVKNFPPESEEVSSRLITRPDDTDEKVKMRLETYKQNVEAMLSAYSDVLNKVDGNRPKHVVFEEIDMLLKQLQEDAEKVESLSIVKGKLESLSDASLGPTTATQEKWRGIPTRLNNIPHSREIRQYFYDDVLRATQRALEDKKLRLKVEINIPELNPEMDVYRIGTLMELVRALALTFADDGKRVKVCVQGSMGEGALAGMPLQLAGTRKILEFMDWGDYDAKGTFINIGSIGVKDVEEQDNIFILVAPQNAVGNCIIDNMKAMTNAAGDRPVILINPRLKLVPDLKGTMSSTDTTSLHTEIMPTKTMDCFLALISRLQGEPVKDLPGSSGIMQTMGREERLKYAASFENCYSFRLLYYAGTQYPIMGALRMAYPNPHELYRRVDESPGKEKYVLIATFSSKPTGDEINDAFLGKPRKEEKAASGIWGFLSGILSA